MPTAADLQSLFQGVLTPLQLQQQDQAQEQQMLQYYAQDTDRPWRVELERSLNTIKKQMPNSPYQQAKRQADANQAVLQGATQKYHDLLKDGSDPAEAELSILSDALDQFSRQGNYEAISALAPSYLGLQAKQAQMAKLRQETATSAARQSKAEVETALAPVKVAEELRTGASTRATQDVQRKKDQFDMSKTTGSQIIDLTQAQAGPQVAKIDPVTQDATISDPATGMTKVLKAGQYKEAPKVTTGGAGKPMPNNVASAIQKAGMNLDMSEQLLDKFRPGFGGYKVAQAGDADMMLKRNAFGDNKGAAEWWSSYQSKVQEIRHGLYGASFTENERKEWDKQAVNPGMRPEVITARLNAQKAIEEKAARRLSKGWSMSYSPDQVSAFLGRSFEDDASPSPEKAPAAGAPRSREEVLKQYGL
jgi:hypothetical protein